MSARGPKKPLLHRLLGWPSLVVGAAMLSLSPVVHDWLLALLGTCVIVFSIAELTGTPSGPR